MRPLVHNLHASYIAYVLRWSPRLQEVFAAVLLNGSGFGRCAGVAAVAT
jgi:hypothetical protein